MLHRSLVQCATLDISVKHSTSGCKKRSSLVFFSPSLSSSTMKTPDLLRFRLQRNHPEVEEPSLAPGQDEGEENQHHVVSDGMVVPLILEHLSNKKGYCACSGCSDDAPMREVKNAIE